MSEFEDLVLEYEGGFPGSGPNWAAYEKMKARGKYLEEENARLRDAARWIPVSEKLPCRPGTFSEPVQAISDGGGYCIVTCWISIDHPLLPKFYLDREHYHLENLMAVDIAYWQPIPKRPEVEMKARGKYLEEENARLRDAARWIPVSERLPKDGQGVFAWHRNFNAWFGYTYTKEFKKDFIRTFSFWRPLIQPPEVE